MAKVRREEILDYVTYGERRDGIRADVMAQKRPRRIHVGSELTFLFENHDTVRYQILEMVRAEQMVKEADIQHELETYNELLGDEGGLGCTLLIEIDDPEVRDVRLRDLLTLPQHIHLELEDGSRATAEYDPRQVGRDRVSSVQFLKFACQGKAPVAMVVDHPALSVRAPLDDAQRAALKQDLAA
ncbi:MAG: DUF3501 family protein [Myxococcales bacterium]|nr:DUF3501 family protein [Myxococcales bacterium]